QRRAAAREGHQPGGHQSRRAPRGAGRRTQLAGPEALRMIRKLIDRLIGGRKGPRAAVRRKPKQYRGSELGVKLEDVSQAAVRTCETLQKAGHQAWIVGGGVRDLLLELKPKDFDVATDATPDQVRALFRRSRIIGRRFQIVHVL